MPLKVIGPRQWTLDTSADLLNQQSQPLVDAVQQQQQQIGQSQPQPSLESSIPSLEVLVGGGSQPQPSPAPSGLPQPQQGDFLSGIPSMDDLLKPLGLDSASRQAQQQQVTTPGIAPTRPTAASGTPAPMPQASASGAEYGPPAGSDSGVIEGADRPSRIASAYRYARAAEARTGVPAEVNLAFAVHESGLEDRYGPGNSFHGRHAVEGEDGTPITDWGYDANGNRVDYPTRLKSYKDASGSFNDFADLIASSPRYRPALDRYRQTGDKAQLVRDIWAAGYGESKTGPDETVDIMDRQVSPLAGQAPQPAPQRPQPATGAPQAMPSAAGEDLTPDQAALDDPDKWALCGPVAAVAMARARGGNWTVAQAKQYAVANGLWNADQGMGGLAAEAKLLNGMGVPASARGVDWNAITSDVQGGNPVTLSTTWVPGGHYVVLEKYDPQTGRFYVGGTGNTLKVTTGRSKWMTIGEMQQLGGIQGALHFDNPASPTPSVAATSPTAGSTPADSSSSAPATPSPTRTGVAGVVPDLNQGTGTQAALSFPMDTPPDGSGYQQPPEVLDRSQAQPSVEDAQRNGRTLIQGIAPDLAQGQGVQRAMTFPEQTPPPSSYNDPTTDGTQTQPLPTPVTSSYNDPTDQGTIAQPLPPQQPAYPSPADDPGGNVQRAQDSQSTPLPYDNRVQDQGRHEAPAPAPSPLKPLYDLGGRVIGYVQAGADAAYQGLAPVRNAAAALDATTTFDQSQQGVDPSSPDYVPPSSPFTRAIQTPIRAPQRSPEDQAAQTERLRRSGVPNPSDAVQATDDFAALPYQAADAVRQTLVDAAESFANAIRAGQEGRPLAAAANAVWGAVQVLPPVARYTALAHAINDALPEMNVLGVGAGDAATSVDVIRDGIKGVNWLARTRPLSAENLARADVVGAVGDAVQSVASAVGRGARALAEEGAGRLMDLTPQLNVVPPGTARGLPFDVQLPSAPRIRQAIENTEGAALTPDGLEMNIARWQREGSAGQPTLRGGVFYSPSGSAGERIYSGGAGGYGGAIGVPELPEHERTLFQRPLFAASGGPGEGDLQINAFNRLQGKGAYERLGTAVRRALNVGPDAVAEVVAPFGVTREDVQRILSAYGAWSSHAEIALKESALAGAARQAGYDSVIGVEYGSTRLPSGRVVQHVLGEIFDLRESHLPTPEGGYTLRPEFQPPDSTTLATPGIAPNRGTGLAARALTDVSNSLGGGVFGGAAGYAAPADSEEQRRQHGLIGAAAGMVGGPLAGRVMRRSEGALATFGVGGNRPAGGNVQSPSQSANQNIRNVARMMSGQYKPVGTERPLGERLVAALTDRYAIHANVPQEARARIAAAGGQQPIERLAERVRENPNSIAAQRNRETLAPALQDVGDDADWLAQYLVHRHNLDIAKGKAQDAYDAAIQAGRTPQQAQAVAQRVQQSRMFSGGMTEKDITQALADMQTEIGPQRFQTVVNAAQDFWKSGQENLDRKVAEGILTQADAQYLKTKYPHYVRTDIADYAEKGPANPSPGGKALGIGNTGIKPISVAGTSKDRVNPILSTIDATYATENAITRNKAARDLVAVRDADPTTAGLFREVAPDVKAYRGNQQTMVPPDYTLRNGEQKMTHWENGVARQFVIPAEYSQLLTPNPGALLGDTASPVRTFFGLMKSLITTHNPAFQYIVSPVRDTGDALVSMQTAAGAAARRPGASALENTAREAGGAVAALPEAVGRLLQAIPQAFEGFTTNSFGKRAAELRKAGMGFEGRPSGEKNLRDAMRELQATGGIEIKTPGDAARIARSILSLGAERVGNRLEMIPRLAAANMERARGGDVLSQSLAGKDATVDFLRGGWLTRQLNVPMMYLNPTVQAAAQNARLAKKSPAAFTAALITTVGIPALLAEAWNRSDPERAKSYEDRPDYLKNNGIIWELPSLPQGTGPLKEKLSNYVWIPLGNHAFAARLAREALGLGDKATGLIPPTPGPAADRSDPSYWAHLGTDILGMFSPVKGGDVSSSVASLIPPVASEAIEAGANRDLYTGATIATDRNDERASNLSKGIANTANRLLGTEWRPSQVEHAISGPTGYAGQLARAASDLGREKDQTRPIQDIPVVGGMASRIIRDSGGQRLQDERDATFVSPAVRQALKDAGLRSDEITMPSSNIRELPITRQEQAQYQRDFNAAFDRGVREALADPDWQTMAPAERERWLKNIAQAARREAGGSVLDHWDDPTFEFRADKKVEKKTGTGP